MTLTITTLCIECHYAECCDLFIVMLNVVMLSAVMLSVLAPEKKQPEMIAKDKHSSFFGEDF